MDLSSVITSLLVVYFVAGLLVLCIGAYCFIEGAVSLSFKLGLPRLLVGSMVMSLATTSPEILVSATAIKEGQAGIALGNIFGSFIANIGLVLGVAGLIRPIKVPFVILHRQIPYTIIALMLLVVLSLGAYVESIDLMSLFALLAIWIVWLIMHLKEEKVAVLPEVSLSWLLTVVQFIGGILGMQLGAYLIIYTAEGMAIQMGVNPYTVGLSIVAIGTSLPELASAIYGSIKKEHELVMSNIIGANVLLILLVFPIVVIFSSQPIVMSGAWGDFLFMGILSVLLWLFSARFDQSWQINRIEALLLLCVFVVYQFFVYR